MPLVDNVWYTNYGNGSSTGYYAVTQWATGAVKAAGAVVRQLATPTNGNERCFICIVAGTTHASTEPTWVVTRGAKTTDNTVTWQEATGQPSLCGDVTNTIPWLTIKNTAVVLGQVIKNGTAAQYFICTTAGTAGNGAEPTWNTTAGATTADNTVTWTSLGNVGSFTAWKNPHNRLANAFATNWGATGNTHFVGSNHAETQSSTLTLAPLGTRVLPTKVLCADSSVANPGAANLATTATISVTGATTLNAINNSGTIMAWYVYGIIFKAGDAANNGTLLVNNGTLAHYSYFENCSFQLPGTGSSGVIAFGTNGQSTAAGGAVKLYNCTLSFAATGQKCDIEGINFIWEGTASAIAGTVPTTVFNATSGNGNMPNTLMKGVDLSAAGSGKTLFSAGDRGMNATLIDCKLGASVTVASTMNGPSQTVRVINSDSGATNYRQEQYSFGGSQVVETTIVRTGGATDGTQAISWKIVTLGTSGYLTPYECIPLAIWNDTTGSNVTVTVYGIWGGGAVPNNDDIWMEVTYLGSSSSPIATVNRSNMKATVLTTAAAQGTDSSTWGGSTTAFKMAVTLSAPQPGLKGPIYVAVKAAKTSSTFYIDPQIALS